MSLIGLASWPGVQQVVRCRYTRSLGIQPGFAILEFLPQPGAIAATGTLSFTFGSRFVQIPRCRVDFGSMQFSPFDGKTAIVKIWDRRWAWRTGRILGRYNIRRVDGTLEPGTEKTPQELASYLLNEMGETGYDVSALPNRPRIDVDWQWANPAAELERLCELLGCRVCLKLSTDRVVIVRPGQGGTLPDEDVQAKSQSVDLAETPDSLELVGDLARFQSKLKLQAIGYETNGDRKPIDQLSYAPTGGWGSDLNFNAITDDTERELAKRHVFRAYQVVSQADGTQNIPQFGDVRDINNIKPLSNFLTETYTDPNGITRFQDAYVEGEWWNADPQFNVSSGANTAEGTRYFGEFYLEGEDGIVRFTEPIYKIVSSSHEAATLYLTCSYNAKDPDSRVPIRYVYHRDLGGKNGTGPRVVERFDLKFTARQTYVNNTQPDDVVTNLSELNEEAQEQLEATLLEYAGSYAESRIYNGIVPIELDGLIRQVTFKVDSEDKSPKGGAETYVSVNSEADPYSPRYTSRRAFRQTFSPRTGLSQTPRFPNP